MNQLLLLAGLLAVPGLMTLLVLMDWLERKFTQQLVADDIALLLEEEADIERVEAAIARIAKPLFTQDVARSA